MARTGTTHELLDRCAELYPAQTGSWRWAKGEWVPVTWKKWRDDTLAAAAAMTERGVGPGDVVAISSTGRYEWMVCDVAISRLGAVSLAVPVSMGAERCGRLISAAGAKLAVAENPAVLARMLDGTRPVKPLERILYFDPRVESVGEATRALMIDDVTGWPPSPDVDSFEDALDAAGAEAPNNEVDPDRVATIVMTAGTCGLRKAVRLSHRALVSNSSALAEALAWSEHDVHLLAVPVWHSMARGLLLASLQAGVAVAVVDGPVAMADAMAQLHPTVVSSMPRVFERICSRVLADVRSSSPLHRGVFNWAMGAGKDGSSCKQERRSPGVLLNAKLAVANRLVFRRVQETLGGKLRFFVSVGGPLSLRAAEFFAAANLLVLESYGFAEAGGITHINRPDAYRFDRVGRPLRGVEGRIEENGRIQVRCDSPMHSYLPARLGDEIGRMAISRDGWLTSGDVGAIGPDDWLRVDARGCCTLHLEGGDEVYPLQIENQLRTMPLISDVVVFGEERPFLTALITLDEDSLAQWARDNGVKEPSHEDLTQSPRVYTAVESIVAQYNHDKPPGRSIRKFAILERELSEVSDELTELLEPRRGRIEERYRTVLDSFYEEQF